MELSVTDVPIQSLLGCVGMEKKNITDREPMGELFTEGMGRDG